MSDWRQVEEAVAAAGFWHLTERGGGMGYDGADWLIAGWRRFDYHVISRWSPNGPLHDFGRLLFDLAGLGGFRLY